MLRPMGQKVLDLLPLFLEALELGGTRPCE